MKPISPIIFLLCIISIQSIAQEGKYIDAYSYGHFTTIKNDFDANYGPYRGLGLDYKHPQTLSFGASVLYTKMAENYVGFKTGLSFANYAQYASSKVKLTQSDIIAYESNMDIQQLSVPFLVNFAINSGSSTDRVYFNMGFGFQINYLTGAKYSLTTDGNYNPITSFEFKDYFYRLGGSYILSTELKIELGRKQRTYLIAGVHYDKTVGGIEKRELDLGPEVPRELVLPLGILKDYNYDVSTDRLGSKMKNEAFAIKLGLSFKLSN